jgi:putative glutamine amidotransferase
VEGDLLHEQEAAINARWHHARVEEGSRLAEIFGSGELHINSFHHQGVKELAPALRARGWAEDGLIEAVEAPDYPWVMGVQWHPERGEAEIEKDRRNPDRRLFWAFAEACREFAAAGVR